MAYIGQESEYIEFQKQTLTADGTTTVFTLDQAVGNACGLLVSVGGAVQEPDVAYTVSAFTITFAVAPTNGYTIYIVYLGKEMTCVQPSDNSIAANAIVDSAVTDSKIVTMAASKLSGSLSGIDGSALTGIVTNTSVIEDNIAVLGFKMASNNSLTRYNMVDQVVDEYQDDDGLLTETNVDRDSSGNYISSVSASSGIYRDVRPDANTVCSTSPDMGPHHGAPWGQTSFVLHNGAFDFYMDNKDGVNYNGGWYYDDFGAGNEKKFSQVMVAMTVSTTGSYNVHASNNASSWDLIHTGANGNYDKTVQSGSGLSKTAGLVYQFTAPTTAYRYWRVTFVGSTQNGSGMDVSQIRWYEQSTTANATGSVISTSSTATSAPTTASLVVLIDDTSGTATVNTDIKGYVSRNGGAGWDQVTLVDQGTWGTTSKKILSANGQTFSNSASGTDMKYKIEVANQSYVAGIANAYPEGHNGGTGATDASQWTMGGAGGGAGGPGQSMASHYTGASSRGHVVGPSGGLGLENDITGTALFYAGGGAGGGDTAGWKGYGGSEVGGNSGNTATNHGTGANSVTAATAPVVNTGSGGGGHHTAASATAGALGIVVIRALTSETSGSTGNWDATAADGNYTYYKWTTATTAGTFTPSQSATYEYLVVAGGGGAGAGGGGAGGYRAGTLTVASVVSGISVGTGGAAHTSNAAAGSNGTNSVFSTITATGGGGGGGTYANGAPGLNGGSGGGGCMPVGAGVTGGAGTGGATGNINPAVVGSGKETRIHATSLAWA